MKWLNKLLEALRESFVNALRDQVDILKNLISVTKLKRTLVRYLGWGLLNMGKPFTRIGNWFWKLHCTVLDWNK